VGQREEGEDAKDGMGGFFRYLRLPSRILRGGGCFFYVLESNSILPPRAVGEGLVFLFYVCSYIMPINIYLKRSRDSNGVD
jgi:hypothetical protein